MYLESSKDILNLSLAISVFGLAFIIAWILVYFLLIMKRLANLLSRIEEQLKAIDSFIRTIKEKLENSASHLSVLALGVKELISYLVAKRRTDTRRSKTT